MVVAIEDPAFGQSRTQFQEVGRQTARAGERERETGQRQRARLLGGDLPSGGAGTGFVSSYCACLALAQDESGSPCRLSGQVEPARFGQGERAIGLDNEQHGLCVTQDILGDRQKTIGNELEAEKASPCDAQRIQPCPEKLGGACRKPENRAIAACQARQEKGERAAALERGSNQKLMQRARRQTAIEMVIDRIMAYLQAQMGVVCMVASLDLPDASAQCVECGVVHDAPPFWKEHKENARGKSK
ncbi:hypothetical protein ABO01nite_29010 [Asaia bogorensis NBRC 16594]|uniref:Uncharacterized protein n=1 Tax=Asaia bogorensis NBRC 16594 TaxID=1231624 RepID=A0AAN4R4W1_9PROT|nr:hypothetical protein ABO01nite_29010 [Asaia bogorensis NBRC 16594]